MLKCLLSSTLKDLEGERLACHKAFEDNPYFDLVGALPAKTSSSSSSYLTTVRLAENCDLYILVIGERFGHFDKSGRSATEIEFDAAYQADPTKIMVFKKADVYLEDDQKKFLEKVSNYRSGYWYQEFSHTYMLLELVKNSLDNWIKDRISPQYNHTPYDKFVVQAIQSKPFPDSQIFYKVGYEDVEIKYEFSGKSYVSCFAKEKISKDFWGTLQDLNTQIQRWRNSL